MNERKGYVRYGGGWLLCRKLREEGSGGREKEGKGNKETGRAMSNLEREVYVR
jgi:hypothetical protein